jgi:hypothetical protein
MQARPIGGRRQDIPAPKRKPAVDDRADLISLVSALRTDTSTAKTGGEATGFSVSVLHKVVLPADADRTCRGKCRHCRIRQTLEERDSLLADEIVHSIAFNSSFFLNCLDAPALCPTKTI